MWIEHYVIINICLVFYPNYSTIMAA